MQDLARHLRDGLIVALVLLATLVGIAASLPGREAAERPLALVFPPWLPRDEAIARSLAAGHAVLRNGASPFIVITSAPSADGVIKPVRPEGVWLMLALAGLAGCPDAGSSEKTP